MTKDLESTMPSVGIRTGFAALDDMIGSHYQNEGALIGLAARPGMGKTLLALDVALHTVKTSGKDVLIFSLEDTKQTIIRRLIAKMSGLPASVIRQTSHWMSEDELHRIQDAYKELKRCKIHIDNAPSPSPAYIAAKLDTIDDPGLVIIDSLEYMDKAIFSSKNPSTTTPITKELQILAKNRHIPLLCCCYLSLYYPPREPTLRDLHHPLLEQNADIILMLYRDSYYTNDPTPKMDPTRLLVCKNRYGPIGTVPLLMDTDTGSFKPA